MPEVESTRRSNRVWEPSSNTSSFGLVVEEPALDVLTGSVDSQCGEAVVFPAARDVRVLPVRFGIGEFRSGAAGAHLNTRAFPTASHAAHAQ
jgi:hypothetical protein